MKLSGTKILVINGRPWFYGIKTEIIDTQNPNFTCILPNYPIESYTGIGGLINENVPIACGGLNGTKINECFYLQNKTWVQGPSLRQARYNMGSGNLVYHNRLLSSGGFDDSQTRLKSMELIGQTKTLVHPGSELPKPMSNHCNVWLNSTHYLLTGGTSDSKTFRSKTMIINVESGQWSYGPSLNLGRSWHGCAKILIGRKQFIFVTGGKDSWITSGTASVEFLDLDKLDQGWIEGLDLPERISSHRMVVSAESLDQAFIVGGFSGKELPKERHQILEMKCGDLNQPETCGFVEIQARLKYPRFGHVAMSIKNSFVDLFCR